MDYKTFVCRSANCEYYNFIENILRASIGFHAEYNEYLENPNLDELGDCYFWWTILVDIFGYKENSLNSPLSTNHLLDRIEKITRIGNIKPSGKKMNLYAEDIELELGKFLKILESVNIEELEKSNTAKLTSRGAL